MTLIKHRSPLLIILSCFLLISCNHTSDDDSANSEQGEVQYTVTFDSTWSDLTHPDDFPSSPHFSGLIGATHNMNVELWKVGELASAGIEQVAETGSKSVFQTEINDQITIGDTNQLISEGGINPSPSDLSFTVTMHPSYSFITLVSMVAPSPDWIIGVAGLNLMENGVWVESKTVDLYVYDAGTDDGVSYTAANADSNPKQFISRIEHSPFLVNGSVKPIGTMSFVKN